MSKSDELIRIQLQNHFKSPVGIRDNEETIYANIAHEPLMLEQVRQIEVLQINDALENGIDSRQDEPVKIKSTWLYVFDKREEFIYSSDGLLFYKGAFYTQQELQDNFGITETPSVVYYAYKGVVKCWYNQELKLYWDVETSAWYQIPPSYDDNPIEEVTDMDEVGAIGLFLYYNKQGEAAKYGSIVKGSDLHPMCMNLPASGYFSYSDLKESKVTGSWKLLTETKKSETYNPCMVLAIKVSNESINNSYNSNTNDQNLYSVTETTEYDI